MKRFKWKLERVLSVTRKREDAARHELLVLARRIDDLNDQIRRKREELRQELVRLGRRPLAERLDEQTIFMNQAPHAERKIEQLRHRTRELEKEREELRGQYQKHRARRKSLERLRADARKQYLKDAERQEQTRFDEKAQIQYTRGGGEVSAPSL